MARGWESKSVESQQEESVRESEQRDSQPTSPEERARLERLASLTLSRTRTLDRLERATNVAHRAMLKRTLLALEREIAELN
ncbi:MAG: hypothetical protein QOC61_2230 [Acidobacteriota bacterium]|nr:hypothetical protein [Acidobacteriota bacterium]MDT5263226.1 hypothetical protein [Acidobacteriota bacterium]